MTDTFHDQRIERKRIEVTGVGAGGWLSPVCLSVDEDAGAQRFLHAHVAGKMMAGSRWGEP
jgi:hypothetical protein